MRNICLALPEELLAEIDEGAKDEFMSRTEYIRRVLTSAMAARQAKVLNNRLGDNPIHFGFLDLDDS